MQCDRCDGFMFVERLSDFFIVFKGLKCVNCGSILDKKIIEHHDKTMLLKQTLGDNFGNDFESRPMTKKQAEPHVKKGRNGVVVLSREEDGETIA